jgi:hypothetical protein
MAAGKDLESFDGRSSRRAWSPDVVTPWWLGPFPDSLLDGALAHSAEPDLGRERPESIELAYMVALHHLPPRDRAALILRDVIGFTAAEVADMLDSPAPAITAALRRARLAVSRHLGSTGRHQAAGGPGVVRVLAERFACAVERGRGDQLASLLTDDVRLSIPPEPYEYRGAGPVAAFLAAYGTHRRLRLLPAEANAQPAFGCYIRQAHAQIADLDALMVLTVDGTKISAVTRFRQLTHHQDFGLPRQLPAG